MIDGLRKAISNFILPRYPWLTGFDIEEIDMERKKGFKWVEVVYYPELDEDKTFTVREGYHEVENLTNKVFKMISDGKHVLYDVKFKSKDF